MSSSILTLFGEEPQPESLNVAPKRAAYGKTGLEEKTGTEVDPLAGWKAEKLYYSVGEVSELFGIRSSNLRFWTKEFDLNVRTTRKGDRLYTAANIQELRRIYHLIKDRGFTIAGARTALQSGIDKDPDAAVVSVTSAHTLDLRNALLAFRNTLINLRNGLK